MQAFPMQTSTNDQPANVKSRNFCFNIFQTKKTNKITWNIWSNKVYLWNSMLLVTKLALIYICEKKFWQRILTHFRLFNPDVIQSHKCLTQEVFLMPWSLLVPFLYFFGLAQPGIESVTSRTQSQCCQNNKVVTCVQLVKFTRLIIWMSMKGL